MGHAYLFEARASGTKASFRAAERENGQAFGTLTDTPSRDRRDLGGVLADRAELTRMAPAIARFSSANWKRKSNVTRRTSSARVLTEMRLVRMLSLNNGRQLMTQLGAGYAHTKPDGHAADGGSLCGAADRCGGC